MSPVEREGCPFKAEGKEESFPSKGEEKGSALPSRDGRVLSPCGREPPFLSLSPPRERLGERADLCVPREES
jgi:hypothetical protein